jgi:hypothetical protein
MASLHFLKHCTQKPIHERTILLRFLSGHNLESSQTNVYIKNKFQTTFAQGGGGVKSVSRVDCE